MTKAGPDATAWNDGGTSDESTHARQADPAPIGGGRLTRALIWLSIFIKSVRPVAATS